MYSLSPLIVRQLINNKLAGKKYNQEQFSYYHLYRNKFNVKREVNQLTAIGGNKFRDNLGFIWKETSTFKNFFHMPLSSYVSSNLSISKPYSRKFLRDDNETGLGGEFEMIVRKDGKRIDGLTQEDYQETYNFGRTENFSQHKMLDVDPHRANPNYLVIIDTGRVKIIDE